MEKNQYTVVVKPFSTLEPAELYSILRLRSEVFVVEQKCAYLDADNKDQYCHHLMLMDGSHVAAYARLIPKGISYDEISIGRVVTSPRSRGEGAGKQLMELAIRYCERLFGDGPIHIGAQTYLRRFYSSFGFQETGKVYDEDGIEHIGMIRGSGERV